MLETTRSIDSSDVTSAHLKINDTHVTLKMEK